MNCCYCQRNRKEIVNQVENAQKFNHKTVIDVLFVDSTNHLACSRCVSDHCLSISNNGRPIMTYVPYESRFMVNKGLLNSAQDEPVDIDVNYNSKLLFT